MDTNKIDERFEDLDRKVAALGHYSSELRRKAAGITRANRAAAMGERNLAQLSEDVAGLRARFDNLGPVAGPAQSEAIPRLVTDDHPQRSQDCGGEHRS